MAVNEDQTLDMKNNETLKELPGQSCIKVRYIQVILLYFFFLTQWGMRVVLSIAIIAMTNEGTSSNPDVPYFNWTNSSVILSAFYWGYAVLQFFAGNLSHFFGNKNLLFVSMFLNALPCALIPLGAKYLGANGVIGLRIFQGLFQGFMIPCLNGIQGRWLPSNELSFLNAVTYSGISVGTMLTKLMTGYISASYIGWPTAFYLLSAMGFAWCLAWAIFGSEMPCKHSTISPEERNHIEQSLGQEDDHLIDRKTIPWKAICKSVPYWAIIIASIGESWLHTYTNTVLPSFLTYAVGLTIQNASLVTAASTLMGMFSYLLIGSISTLAIKRKWLSIKASRATFESISMFTSLLVLLLYSYIDSATIIAALMISSSLLGGGVSSGHLVNHVDLSPRYAATLTGISNGFGQLIAILAPLLVQWMVTETDNKTQWRSTFLLAGAIGTITTIFFAIFSSGDRQWWDEVDQKKVNTDLESKTNQTGETNNMDKQVC